MSARPGEECVINRAMHLCNPRPTCFLAGNRARNDVAVVAFKNMFTSTELLHYIRILCPGAQFLVNCFEEIVMATNNTGLDSNYLLLSEKRREREEEKGIE